MDAPSVNPLTDPPPSLIAVPVPKAFLLLTYAEYVRGVKREKWWQRNQAEVKHEADAVAPKTPRAPRGLDAQGYGRSHGGQKECEKR